MVKFDENFTNCVSSGDGMKIYPIARDAYNVGVAYHVALTNKGDIDSDTHKELVLLLRQYDLAGRIPKHELADFLEKQDIVIAS